MLSEYNRKLDELRGKMVRRGKLDSMLYELRRQETELAARVGELASQLQLEQADVDRLTGGFRSVFYAVIGKRTEMLEKEQAEVLAASMKLETAKKELEAVQKEIFRLDWEAGSVKRYEREYQELLIEKAAAMKEMSAYADRITEIEEKKGFLAIQIRETNEAMAAGRSVLAQFENIEQSLSDAETCAQWDVWTRRSLINQIEKWSYLDDAKNHAEKLEWLLRKFKAELSDLSIQTDFGLPGSDGLRFADWFFDGLFVDIEVLSRIQDAQKNLAPSRYQVQNLLSELRKYETGLKRKIEELDLQLRTMAEEA